MTQSWRSPNETAGCAARCSRTPALWRCVAVTLDERVALAWRIMDFEYPSYDGAWLKALPVGEQTEPIAVVRAFLADELYVYIPEHAPWDVFNYGTWNRALDDDLPERVGEILRHAADGAVDRLRRGFDDDGMMVDHEVLRRLFTVDLWGGAEPAWFINTDRRADLFPAAIGVDDGIVAMLWHGTY
jgi:hypothetical protein